VILVNYSMFRSIFYNGNGAAVNVWSSTSTVFLQSCSFFNCTAGAETADYVGGCAYLYNVLSGSGAADCCAASCGARYGSFWYLGSNADAVVKGLAAFDCRSADGALVDRSARVRVLGCNFTSQTGA
jgi:hypothetical protein